MADVVVVGGGVIGCATAWYLARAGATVTLIERGELGSEASGAAAGMLAALSDEGGDHGPEFLQLCLDGLAAYEDALSDLVATGVDVRYNRSGILHLARSASEAGALRRRYESQQRIAPDNQWLEGDALRATEPQAGATAVAGLLSPSEHYLDPQRLVLALAAAAEKAGARIITGEAVSDILAGFDKSRLVRTTDGDYEADAVLLAGGSWTADLAERLDAAIPVSPVRGQMISLRGPATPLRHILWGEPAYLVPREDGQTFVGATVEKVGFINQTTDEGIARLRSAAAELVPDLAGAEVIRAWSGLRPATPDGLPILGLLPGHEDVWVATGHYRNGILLAPITGRLMAEAIIEGKPQGRLLPFSPSRFVS